MKNYRTQHGGYIAVVSALILCSLLTVLVFVESTETFWSRFDELALLHKAQSLSDAESCAYEALLAYAEGTSSTLPVRFPSESCSIDLIRVYQQPNSLEIYTHAAVSGVYSLLDTTASLSTTSGIVSITESKERTSIPP